MQMAKQHKKFGEGVGVVVATAVAALWFYALANISLVYVFQAPGAEFELGRVLIALVATALWIVVSKALGGDG